MFITGVNDTSDKLFSGSLAINPCHGFSMIAGDNNTGDKFIDSAKNKDATEVGSCQG
jgi:hypothetical protein